MPLSENEQRTLDEMERALHVDDPAFSADVDLDRLQFRRLAIRFAVFLLGLVLLLAGAVMSAALLSVGVVTSVLGFLVMTASATPASGGRHDS